MNPNEGGGIAAYFNQAHATATSMLLWPGDKSSCFHHLGDFAGFSYLVVIKDKKSQVRNYFGIMLPSLTTLTTFF